MVLIAFNFGVLGLRILSNVSAAAASADWMAWAYMSDVILVFECPSLADTVRRLVPAAISNVAFVCP